MEIEQPLTLLGGLSPAQFMKKHWQKKPLLVHQAMPGFKPLLSRAELFALAGDEAVESRLVSRGPAGWQLRRGPFARRALPPIHRPDWTLLVQGVDLHYDVERIRPGDDEVAAWQVVRNDDPARESRLVALTRFSTGATFEFAETPVRIT